ncbi:MAG: hypothetical protein QOF35_1415, partial [Actinomycetota bacterium]|nr:hypothetical protein [Actinomycetota bacterium]
MGLMRHVRMVIACSGSDLVRESDALREEVLPELRGWCELRFLSLDVDASYPAPKQSGPDSQHQQHPAHLDAAAEFARLRDLVLLGDVLVVGVFKSQPSWIDLGLAEAVLETDAVEDGRSFFFFGTVAGGEGGPRSDFALTELRRDIVSRGGRIREYDTKRPISQFAQLVLTTLIAAFDTVDFFPEPSHHGPTSPPPELLLPLSPLTPPSIDQPVQAAPQDTHEPPLIDAGIDENVQFTVYRPRKVRPDLWYPMLAFAHLAERRPDAPEDEPDPIEQVKALAAQTLGDQLAGYTNPTSDARGAVPKEGELTLVPAVDGIEFNPARRGFRWVEDVHKEEFRLRAQSRLNQTVARGRLTVYLGAFILADVDLAIAVDSAAPLPPRPLSPAPQLPSKAPAPLSSMNTKHARPHATAQASEFESVAGHPYRKIFPSYSHLDLEIVHQAEVIGHALGDVYVRDRTALRSGEQWQERLLQLIDEADVFQLFWSSNSMRSDYVRREWEHALTVEKPYFIRPTYWENPMPRSMNPELPPAALNDLHFQALVEALPESAAARP